MEESWIITGKTIATIIRNATHLSPFQIKELIAEARRECPKCKYHIDNSDVLSQWPGLPAGVKFDPSDLELLGHLEGKVGRGNISSHMLIDDFIPTIEEVEGICYTHPENLPGVNMDGSRSHFFHRISNAYDCGKRKRRKISNSDHIVSDEHIRWHKTGKSTAILDNGVIKGWKKILVLHKGSKKVGGKIDKANWTMHQYHLGVEEDEKHGELVVSKVFWQLRSKQTGKSQMHAVNVETDSFAVEIDPTTPNPPQPRRPNSSTWGTEQNQEEEEFSLSTVQLKAEAEELAWSAGTSQAVEDAALPDLDEQPLCNATLDSSHEKPLPLDYCSMDDLHGFSELNYKCLGTPPDLGTLAEMQFGSQDSLGSWLDRM